MTKQHRVVPLATWLLVLFATCGLMIVGTSCSDEDDEEILEPIDLGYSATSDTVTLMTWNTGHWAKGLDWVSAVNDTTYDLVFDSLVECIREIKPHVIGLNEVSDKMIDSEMHPRVYTTKLFKRMGFKHQFLGNGGEQRYWVFNTIASMLPLGPSETKEFNYNWNYWQPHLRNYYYVVSSFRIGNTEVPLIVTHLGFSEVGDTCAIGQIEELAELSKNYDRLVIMGDFNNKELKTMMPFREAGMTVCNYDTCSVATYPASGPTKVLDNIVVKGVRVIRSGSLRISPELSDHYPYFAEIAVDE